MRVTVTGKGLDVGDSLRTHVEERLSTGVGKYFDRPVDMSVVFSRDAHNYRCDGSVQLPTGLHAQAQAGTTDIYAAFEQVAERIEKQLRRYKRRLRNHHQNRAEPVERVVAPSYVIENPDEEPETEANPDPVIIAEMETDIKSLTVGEAVMQMELAHSPFLIFKNQANGRLNVVFQREDGNVGWVDPANFSDA